LAWGPAPQIVDIGGGYGLLGLEMAMKGWSATVIDYDPAKSKLGRWLTRQAPRRLPIEFHTMSMEALPEHGVPVTEPPHAISFFQCLFLANRERVPDIIRTAFARLAPGGTLIILERLRRCEASNNDQFAAEELFELMTRNAAPPKLVSMRDGSFLTECDPDSTAFLACKPKTN
jgi:2-polyprenyl-3-methyl-5-hydroxy-6-metoxy-1,4-benzoquinol methylase